MSDKFTIYHNPRCSKSREALALLEDMGIKPELRLYLEKAPDRKELETVLTNLGIPARQLLRNSEEAYKSMNLADTTLTDAELISAMIREPRLIQRPIAISGNRAVIGRPPANILELLV